MNLPLLILHGHHLSRQPRMATAGVISALATLGPVSYHHPILDLVYALGLLQFVHTLHGVLLNDTKTKTHMVKYVVATIAIVVYPEQTLFVETFLVVFATYIALQLSRAFILLNYLLLLVEFSCFESTKVFTHICIFSLVAIGYEMVELDAAIKDAKFKVTASCTRPERRHE